MDNYEVIRLVGEGSFGRVFQAKQKVSSRIVALKVISKRGRSEKELKGLRRECEIQRHLHHPNIIQMLDSFETEDEIYVITEFAHKELYIILGKEGYLPEERVQTIVWDLVSALYYLHSHRVLHRDLKPQNILLDVNDCAKLCDFGFARNMSTGTHVLTSIKGTPLYMAPELIEEHPYDHNADLWSLGCIIYELLVGAPPFCTTSILHLVRLIRHEQVQWPNFISDICVSFLQGLLQKDPGKRMTWPDILKHPFVEGHIIITEDTETIPLTKPLPPCQLEAKERQFHDLSQKATTNNRANDSISDLNREQMTAKSSTEVTNETEPPEHDNQKRDALSSNLVLKTVEENAKVSMDKPRTKKSENKPEMDKNKSREGHLTKLSQNLDNFAKKINNDSQKMSKESDNKASLSSSDNINNNVAGAALKNQELNREDVNKTPTTTTGALQNWNWAEESQPIECEEWLAFLQKSMQEIMNGELASLCQPNLTSIIVAPLRNCHASCKVIEYVVCLLSLPFTVPEVSRQAVAQVTGVYVDVKVVPNLVYASKLLVKSRPSLTDSNDTTPTPTNTPAPSIQPALETYRSMSDLSADELQALEYIYLLICRLVHIEDKFIGQFCDAITLLNISNLIQQFLLLSKRKLKIVTDIIAILTQVLRKFPENAELVEKILFCNHEKQCLIDIVHLLRHFNPLLRARVCFLLRLIAKFSCKTLQEVWSTRMQETLEALMYDSIENVRNAAEATVAELKTLAFYDQNCVSQ